MQRSTSLVSISLLILGTTPALAQTASQPATSRPATQPAPASTAWPQFRGPQASGVADGFAVPQEWDVAKGMNIAWKTKLDGMAHSSPIVWGNRIFVTNAVKKGEAKLKVGLYGSIMPVDDDSAHKMQLICLDRTTGKTLWTQTAWEGVPKIKRHPKGSHAASSPATDGKHVAAFFASEGLHVYDFDGNLLWKKSFGVLDSGYFLVPRAQWGFASSPVIHEGRIYLQCDVQKDSFVTALDVKTGDEVWRAARKEVPTWGTPTVITTKKRRQLVLNGWKHMGGYDLDTGKELWRLDGGGDIPVPTPIVAQGMVFLTSAHGRKSPILAISTMAKGKLSLQAEDSEHVVWSYLRGGNYLQTPIAYRGALYCCRDNGVLSCFDLLTGKRHYRKRLGEGGSGFTASAVAADGKLFFTSEAGDVYVVQAGPEFALLATNPLGETCMASPAVHRGALLFRARHHLIAVAAPK